VIPINAIRDFRLFFSTCRIKTFSAISTGLDDIQKKYRTCAQWTILLSIQLLANIQNFIEDFSIVDNFFKNLSKQTSEIKSLDEFNDNIFDFMIFFHKLMLGVAFHLGAEKHNIPPFARFLHEFIRGNYIEQKMNPEATIYQTMTTIRHKLQPYFSKDFVIVVDEEMKVFDDKMMQAKIYERELRFDTSQFFLEILAANMKEVASKSGVSSCEFNQLKRKFREKAREQLLDLLIFSEDQTPEQWIATWYEKKLRKSTDKLLESVKKIEMFKNHSSGSALQHFTTELETARRELEKETESLLMHDYLAHSVEFFAFINEIEESLSQLDKIQQALLNLKNQIQVMTKNEDEGDAQSLIRLHNTFQTTYNELLFHIDDTLRCGKNPNEWLADWFRFDISRDIKTVLAESQNPGTTEETPGFLVPLQNIKSQLWRLYKSNKNIEMANNFLAFVGKNKRFLEKNATCNDLQQTLIRMKNKMQSDGFDTAKIRQFRETMDELLALLPQINVTSKNGRQWIEMRFREHNLQLMGNYQSKIDQVKQELEEFMDPDDQHTEETRHILQRKIRELEAKNMKLIQKFNARTYLNDAAEFIKFTNLMRKRNRNKWDQKGGVEKTRRGDQEVYKREPGVDQEVTRS
jgi:hypothetical protein